MAADAQRLSLPDLVEAMRTRALGAAVVAGVLAIGGLVVVESDAPELYDGLTSGAGLAAVIASALAGVVTLGLVWSRRFEPARYTAGAAVGAMLAGLALAMRPDFLPGQLTFEDAAAGDSTMIATLIAIALALAVIVPSLVLLFRLKLEGKLGEEFHPIGSSEPEEPA